MQFGLAFISGIVLVPIILRQVGTQNYGLWLAWGELLAYSAMVDFGVLGVLPWIIAEKDGQNDRQAIRSLITNGLALASITGVIYISVTLILWNFASSIVKLSEAQRETLLGPLLLVIAGIAVSFPLRTFYTALQGLQDVVFSGLMGVAQWGLNICLILVLLFNGYGLYSLAASVVVPPLVLSILSFLRLKAIAPDLLTGWDRPSLSKMLRLTKEGLGTWMGGFGWRMTAATNSAIIVSVSSPERVVVYACSAKMGEILMQMAWQLSDSGLVGLAQLSGEGKQERVREVVVAMLRLLLIAAGGVAYAVLAFNPSFVGLWVGADKFGGFTLNILLSAAFIGLSLTHGLFVPAAVLGNRFQVGLVTLIQGIFHLVAAVALGHVFGLPGVALASIFGSFVLAFPLGARILRRCTRLTSGDLWGGALVPWFLRVVPILVLGAAVGMWIPQTSISLPVLLAPLMGFLYIWYMRPLYSGLPLPTSVKPWLMRMRLLPHA